MNTTTGTVGRSTTIHAVNTVYNGTRCGAENRYRNGRVSIHSTAKEVTCKRCIAKTEV